MKLFTFLFLATSALAQQGTETAPHVRQIRIELLVVQLPERRAITLQRDLRDPARVKRGQQALLDLIDKGEAQLVDWPIVRTLAGNRVVAENISEIRYPIEFAQPRVIENPVSPDATITQNPIAPDAAAVSAEISKPKGSAKEPPKLLAGIPTTFETRNAGVTLEIEPVISDDGKTVSMQLAPQHVMFNGNRRTTVEAPGQYSVSVDQPMFHTQKVSTNVVVKSGEPYLFGFQKLPTPERTVEIWMLTATVETTPLGEAPSAATDKASDLDSEGQKKPEKP